VEPVQRAGTDVSNPTGEGPERFFQSLVDHVADLIVVISPERELVYVNHASMRILGVDPDDIRHHDACELVHYDDLWFVMDGAAVEARFIQKDGALRTLDVVVTDMRDDTSVGAVVVTARDIAERMVLTEQRRHPDSFHEVTGLPTHEGFIAQVDAILGAREPEHGPSALVSVTLDGIDDVEDLLGLEARHELLVRAAERLSAAVRVNRDRPVPDVVGHLEGDEMAALLTEVRDTDAAMKVAERLVAALSQPYLVQEHEIVLDATAGLVLVEESGDATKLLDRARGARTTVNGEPVGLAKA
jgi:PAS domain S-box-containing protein